MLANWMVRHEGMSTGQAVSTFAAFRPPGIYKDSYIDQLFKYNHEARQALHSLPWSVCKRSDPRPCIHAQLAVPDMFMPGESFPGLMTSTLMPQAEKRGDSPGASLEVGGWA